MPICINCYLTLLANSKLKESSICHMVIVIYHSSLSFVINFFFSEFVIGIMAFHFFLKSGITFLKYDFAYDLENNYDIYYLLYFLVSCSLFKVLIFKKVFWGQSLSLILIHHQD